MPEPSESCGLSVEHEARCRRCGVSCHPAIPVNGVPVVVPGLACRFLAKGIDGRFRCTVYARRFDVAPWCQTAEQALRQGFLAHDCPYAARLPLYRGKHVLSPAQLRRLAPVLRQHVAEVGVPYAVAPEAAIRFLEQDGSRWEARWVEEEARYRFRRRET